MVSKQKKDGNFTDVQAAADAVLTPRVQDPYGPKITDIADINFGSADMYQYEYMNKLSLMRNQYVKNLILIKNENESESPNEKTVKKLNDTNGKTKEKFDKIYTEFRQKVKEDEDVIEDTEQSCKYAYITFRCMDALDHVRIAYDIPWWKRMMIMKFGSEERKEKLKKLHFFKKWPTVHVASEPDNIKWANLRYPLR